MEKNEVILVASDVNPAPTLVNRVSTDLNAKLFTPHKVLSSLEKKKLAREYCERYGLQLKNEHELDALSAALKAFSHYKRKFEQIEAYVKESGIKIPIDELKEKVVKGKTIKRAVQTMMGKPSKEEAIKRPKHHENITELKRRIKKLNEQVLNLREECKRLIELNAELKRQILALEKERAKLEAKLMDLKDKRKAEIKKEREFYILLEELKAQKERVNYYASRMEEYERRLKKMELIREIESKGQFKLVKKVENFTKESIERAILQQNISEGDVVMLINASGGGASTAEMLVELGVKAVIICSKISHLASEVFSSNGTPVIPIDRIKVNWVYGSPYVKSEDLEKALREWRIKEKEDILKNLIGLVKDYRKERWSKLNI